MQGPHISCSIQLEWKLWMFLHPKNSLINELFSKFDPLEGGSPLEEFERNNANALV